MPAVNFRVTRWEAHTRELVRFAQTTKRCVANLLEYSCANRSDTSLFNVLLLNASSWSSAALFISDVFTQQTC